MTRPSASTVSQALRHLQDAGYTWKTQGGGDLHEHLARHAPNSLTVGSKYSEQAWSEIDALHQLASDLSIIALANAHAQGKPLRVESIIPYPHAGTEGVASQLVCAGLSTLTRTRIIRDPGTIYEQALETVVLTEDQPFPSANQFIVPAGLLGDTKELGIYTMFPGSASRPFPRKEQATTDPNLHAANVSFWRDHFFLATPTEAINALQVGLEQLHKTEAPAMDAADYHHQEIARLKDLAANYRSMASLQWARKP